MTELIINKMKTIKTTRYSDAHTSAHKSYIKKGPTEQKR